MRKIFTLFFLFILGTIVRSDVEAQALYPVGIDEKIAASSDILEGKVVAQQSFWNPQHTMIYTANTVEIYQVFKGNYQGQVIEVMTIGGSVGDESIDASDLLTLEKDNIGVFFCYPNSINLRSPSTGNVLYDVYSSGQGCYKYDLNSKSANAPFVRYNSIQNKLYPELVQKIGQQPRRISSIFDIANMPRPLSPQSPFIASFLPMTVNAGATLDPANNLLTITGTGFENAPSASSAILFDDANDGDGGTPYVVAYNSSLVVSWSDVQIKVRVPSRAGTGFIQVRDAAGNTFSSTDQLTVNFGVLTSGTTVIKESNLMNDNGSGGYTILYCNSTAGGGVDLDAAPEKLTFQRALTTWKEVAGFNVTEGGTTGVQTINPSDGNNVIMFDNTNTGNAPMSSGVLATCYSFNSTCTPAANFEQRKTEFDIVIRNAGVSSGSVNFVPGPCPPSTSSASQQYDMETVILHELGHALNLAHVNDDLEGSTVATMNPGKLMNYAVMFGVSRKSPDYAAYAGALYCINPQANAYGNCTATNTEMAPLARITESKDDCPLSFPSITTPVNTSVNFDLVHATSNKFVDPQYTDINCSNTGVSVTNNAYYAIKTDADGGTLIVTVSNYVTVPASVQASCAGAGIRLALYKVSSCPTGQAFPTPPNNCIVFNANGPLTTISGLTANSNYLMFLEGVKNTKATFTLTFTGSSIPVTLLNFNGILANKQVNLYWKTSQEINSKEFNIEKSIDGITFSSFGVVPAKGNSNTESSYFLTDQHPYPNYSYYRLKMLDINGHYRYSPVVKIKTVQKAIAVTNIFPNPAKDNLNIELVADTKQQVSITAFDMAGKKLLSAGWPVEAGLNTKKLPIENLAAGIYFIEVKDGAGNSVEKTRIIKY